MDTSSETSEWVVTSLAWEPGSGRGEERCCNECLIQSPWQAVLWAGLDEYWAEQMSQAKSSATAQRPGSRALTAGELDKSGVEYEGKSRSQDEAGSGSRDKALARRG